MKNPLDSLGKTVFLGFVLTAVIAIFMHAVK